MLRIELEKFLTRYKEEIITSADALLEKEMPPLTEELFCLFEKTGNRSQYEAVYFTRRKLLAVFGMRTILEQEEHHGNQQIYLQKLSEVISDICQEECWAVPAHVNRTNNSDWRVTVDLFAAETAQTLAELLDRLGQNLPQAIHEMVTKNIEKRIFHPYFLSKVPYGIWEHSEHNWNAVCAGSIGSACLRLMRDQPERLKKSLERIMESLSYYIKGFADDGTCMEGLGYFNYGMIYFSNFAQELYDFTDGKVDLFCGKWDEFEISKEDKRYLIAQFPAKCFFPDGKSLSFSDGGTDGRFRVGVSSVLAMHYGKMNSKGKYEIRTLFPNMARTEGLHTDICYRFAALKMDLIYTKRLLSLLQDVDLEDETGEKANSEYLLPSAQWYIAHSASDVGFACKGGHNGEPHNHNDVGHFIYEAGGSMFLTDLGAGEYTKEYFNEGRYQILCNNSFGHSVPIINEQGQGCGKQYACEQFYVESNGCVHMELHTAYPERVLESFHREFRFDQCSGNLGVRDDFVFPDIINVNQMVKENLITQILPLVRDNHVILNTNTSSCVITINECKTDISIVEYDHSNHSGNIEKVYAIQWQVPLIDGKAKSSYNIRYEICD